MPTTSAAEKIQLTWPDQKNRGPFTSLDMSQVTFDYAILIIEYIVITI